MATEAANSWLSDAAVELAKLSPAEREQRLDALRTQAVLRADADHLEEPPPIREFGEYLDTKIELPARLVHPFQLVRGGTTVMIARAGKGKTTFTLNRIMRWSVGKRLFEGLPGVMEPEKPLRTLIIENEGSPGFFQETLRDIFEAQNFTAEEAEQARRNILIWGEGGFPRMKLDDNETYDMVRRGIEQYEPDVVLMEPFRTLWSGEENSATEMQECVDRIGQITGQYSCGVLLTHHERKSGAGEDGEQMSAGRGSTVLEGEVAVMERWKQINDEVSEVSWVKSRYGKAAVPVRMRWSDEARGYTYISEATGQREVLEILREHAATMSVREIAEALDDTQAHVRPLAKMLASDDTQPVTEIPSQRSPDGGSTGKRYRYNDSDEEYEPGGLSFR